VIGQSTDWLTFWGSYLGGILAAAIGFFTLYFNLKQNQLVQQIQMKKQSIEDIKRDIMSRLEQIDFTQLYRFALKQPADISREAVDKELFRLNTIHSQATAMADSWGAVHEHDTDKCAKEFNKKYFDCINAYKSEIDSLTKFFKEEQYINHYYSQFNLEELAKMLTDYKENRPDYFKELFDAASFWINHEQKQLKELIDKHNNVFL